MQDIALERDSASAMPHPFRDPASHWLRLALLMAAGLAVAFVAAFFTLIVIGDAIWATFGRNTVSFAAVGFFPALAWVWCGAQVMRDARYRVPFATLLFASGTYVAWDTMSSVSLSPCYGLVDQAGVCVGGGIGLLLATVTRRREHRRAFRTAMLAAVTLAALALTFSVVRAWTTPALGVYAEAHVGDETYPVRLLTEQPPTGLLQDSVLVIWAEGSSIAPVGRGVESGLLRVQQNFRSGGAEAYRASPVPAETIRATAELSAAAYMRAQLSREIADGTSPPICARFPLPRADLSDVRFFRITRVTGP